MSMLRLALLTIACAFACSDAQAGLMTWGNVLATFRDPAKGNWSFQDTFNYPVKAEGVSSGYLLDRWQDKAAVTVGGIPYVIDLDTIGYSGAVAEYGYIGKGTTASVGYGSYDYIACRTAPCIEQAHAVKLDVTASGETRFDDAITLVSSVLAPGTPVDVRFDILLRDDLYQGSTDPVAGDTPVVGDTGSASFQYFVAGGSLGGGGSGVLDAHAADERIITILVNAAVGDIIAFNEDLMVTAYAYSDWAPWQFRGARLYVDSGDSALTIINVLNPDVGYVAASGTVYGTEFPSPDVIPEPMSLMLLVSGLAGVSFRRRSRR